MALNGRFLAAPATGVQRVAEELIKQLDILLGETPATVRLDLVRAPKRQKASCFKTYRDTLQRRAGRQAVGAVRTAKTRTRSTFGEPLQSSAAFAEGRLAYDPRRASVHLPGILFPAVSLVVSLQRAKDRRLPQTAS